jgi:hypothetical protein
MEEQTYQALLVYISLIIFSREGTGLAPDVDFTDKQQLLMLCEKYKKYHNIAA